MIINKNYYIVELVSLIDFISYNVLCSEKELAKLLDNFDTNSYKLGNVSGIGEIETDMKKFLKETKGLEIG